MANAMGDISLDNGYAEALIIFGGQTIKGVGGGVCQVSTTLFRDGLLCRFSDRRALRPRLPRRTITNKSPATASTANLAGLDATVFVPIGRFQIHQRHALLAADGNLCQPRLQQLTWKFYSTNDGRSVEWNTTGPTNIVPAPDDLYRENPDLPSGKIKQVDWAADGADVTVIRTVYKDGSLYLDDVIRTHYEPWQAVFEYGPGTPGMPPGDISTAGRTGIPNYNKKVHSHVNAPFLLGLWGVCVRGTIYS